MTSLQSEGTKTPSTAQADYVRKVCTASDPLEGAAILQRALTIPDLKSRSGLKKVHDDFCRISDQLFGLLEKHRDTPQFINALLHVFMEMCKDSMLASKLHGRGLVAALIPLLSEKSSRLTILLTFKSLAMTGGHVVLSEMARPLTPVLIKLMMDNTDDDALLTACMRPLGLVLTGAMDKCHRADPEVLRNLDAPGLLRLLVKILRRPAVHADAVDDCIIVSTLVGHRFPKELRRNEDMVRFFVGGLRCSRLDYRTECLHALFAASYPDNPAPTTVDTSSIASVFQRGLDAQLGGAMEVHGFTRCELPKALFWQSHLDGLIQQYSNVPDAYSLGLKLANYTTSFPYGPPDVPTWGMAGLPFDSFPKALRFCSEQLQKMALSQEDAHIPDLLETNYLLIQGKYTEAAELAEAALFRFPEVAWFYYVVAHTSNYSINTEKGARAAKRGIKCTVTTPFLYHLLLHMAADKGAHLAIDLMRSTPPWQSCDAVCVLYDEALRDAKTYISDAPPDHQGMRSALNWYFMLLVLVQGPTLPKDLNVNEIMHIQQKLEIAEKFQTIWLGMTDTDTSDFSTNWVRKRIMRHYASAYHEWRVPIEQIDDPYRGRMAHPIREPSPDLDAWLKGSITLLVGCGPSYLTTGPLERCAWCKNMSAILRKCSRCAKVRYCDPMCQRADWARHKLVCVKK